MMPQWCNAALGTLLLVGMLGTAWVFVIVTIYLADYLQAYASAWTVFGGVMLVVTYVLFYLTLPSLPRPYWTRRRRARK